MSNDRKQTQVIRLHDIFGATISTRQAVAVLIKSLERSSRKIVLDFQQVVFVSRSFAHELLCFERTSQPHFEKQNLSKDVEKMFEIVRHSSHAQSKDVEEITDSSIDISHSVANF